MLIAAPVVTVRNGLGAGLLSVLSAFLFRVVFAVRDSRRLRPATVADADRIAAQVWDYIIVGGGTAGCVLANRLSARTRKRVLVLEAGFGDYNATRIRIPAGVLDLFQSKCDWNFRTSSEPVATSSDGVYLCRGKVLGGSSCVNVMLYNRGSADDYNAWRDEFGLEGWGAKDVLPYFRRTEDARMDRDVNPDYHGFGGEWSVSNVRYQNPLSKSFLDACSEAGLPSNHDFNDWSREQEGAGRFSVSQRNGVRASSASALLAPAMADEKTARHLRVVCGVHASRIVVEGGAANGVEFMLASGDDAQRFTAHLVPAGEVLLASGSLHSPQLLMLSGIGPKGHLEAHGIPLVHDLPGVGENLQDHPAANVSYECPTSAQGVSPTSSCMFIFGKKIPHPFWILRWFLFGSGPLTSPGCDHGGFFRTVATTASKASGKKQPEPEPDLQMRFLPARAVTADGMNSFAAFRSIRSLPDGFSFQSIAARPYSRGRVRLASCSAREKPLVEGGYLQDRRDVATLREGLRLSRRLARQPAFGSWLGPEVFPGSDVQSDEQLDAYIAANVHTANALVGTCKMGRPDDAAAVCDGAMRVLGITGVRVCDASIMPRLPGGQTAAPTVMIAERAADFIIGKGDRN